MRVVERGPTALTVELDGSLYPQDVIFKCFYWYTDAFDVDINQAGPAIVVVRVQPRDNSQVPDWPEIEQRVKQDLIDYRTRDIVSRETHDIRALLIAKAFAHFDDLEQPPPGTFTDPVGIDTEFDPEQ